MVTANKQLMDFNKIDKQTYCQSLIIDLLGRSGARVGATVPFMAFMVLIKEIASQDSIPGNYIYGQSRGPFV